MLFHKKALQRSFFFNPDARIGVAPRREDAKPSRCLGS